MARITINDLWETIEWLNAELEKTKTIANNPDESMGKILTDIPRSLETDLISIINSDRFIDAIKLYRSMTRLGLREAKAACDKLRFYAKKGE